MKNFIILLFLFGMIFSAVHEVYVDEPCYVNSSGGEQYNVSAPLGSLNEVFYSQVNDGDTVILCPGTYTDSYMYFGNNKSDTRLTGCVDGVHPNCTGNNISDIILMQTGDGFYRIVYSNYGNTIGNLTFISNNLPNSWTSEFIFVQTNGSLLIENSKFEITHTLPSSVYAWRVLGGNNLSDSVIRNSNFTFMGNGSNKLAVVGLYNISNLSISNCIFSNVLRVLSNSWGQVNYENISFYDNTLYNSHFPSYISPYFYRNPNFIDFNVSDNFFYQGSTLYIHYGNSIVQNNQINDSDIGIIFSNDCLNDEETFVSNNQINNSAIGALLSGCNFTLSNNEFNNNDVGLFFSIRSDYWGSSSLWDFSWNGYNTGYFRNNVSTNNSIDGSPIYYFVDGITGDGETEPNENAAMVIIVDSEMEIENINFTNALGNSHGIFAFNSEVNLTNVSTGDNFVSISFLNSNGSISECEFNYQGNMNMSSLYEVFDNSVYLSYDTFLVTAIVILSNTNISTVNILDNYISNFPASSLIIVGEEDTEGAVYFDGNTFENNSYDFPLLFGSNPGTWLITTNNFMDGNKPYFFIENQTIDGVREIPEDETIAMLLLYDSTNLSPIENIEIDSNAQVALVIFDNMGAEYYINNISISTDNLGMLILGNFSDLILNNISIYGKTEPLERLETLFDESLMDIENTFEFLQALTGIFSASEDDESFFRQEEESAPFFYAFGVLLMPPLEDVTITNLLVENKIVGLSASPLGDEAPSLFGNILLRNVTFNSCPVGFDFYSAENISIFDSEINNAGTGLSIINSSNLLIDGLELTLQQYNLINNFNTTLGILFLANFNTSNENITILNTIINGGGFEFRGGSLDEETNATFEVGIIFANSYNNNLSGILIENTSIRNILLDILIISERQNPTNHEIIFRNVELEEGGPIFSINYYGIVNETGQNDTYGSHSGFGILNRELSDFLSTPSGANDFNNIVSFYSFDSDHAVLLNISNISLSYTNEKLATYNTNEDALGFYLLGEMTTMPSALLFPWIRLTPGFECDEFSVTHDTVNNVFSININDMPDGFGISSNPSDENNSDDMSLVSMNFAIFYMGNYYNQSNITNITNITNINNYYDSDSTTINQYTDQPGVTYSFECPGDKIKVILEQSLGATATLYYYGLLGTSPPSTSDTQPLSNKQVTLNTKGLGLYKLEVSITGEDKWEKFISQFWYFGCDADGEIIKPVDPDPKSTCSSNLNCADNEKCTNGKCVEILGICGYADKHQWFTYDCCSSTDCDSGLICTNHVCSYPSYSILASDNENLGDQAKIRVMLNGEPAKNTPVEVLTPSGKKLLLTTDENGYISLTMDEEGEYKIYAGNGYKAVKSLKPAKPVDEEDKEEDIFGDSGSIIAGTGVAIGAILVGAAAAFRIFRK
ncbi:MAG: hypothetical protein PHU63_00160 [Candidatus ainarchaeum sp.]|nr:hypothetical protein [Candidatus ainarchaeum sp.]